MQPLFKVMHLSVNVFSLITFTFLRRSNLPIIHKVSCITNLIFLFVSMISKWIGDCQACYYLLIQVVIMSVLTICIDVWRVHHCLLGSKQISIRIVHVGRQMLHIRLMFLMLSFQVNLQFLWFQIHD